MAAATLDTLAIAKQLKAAGFTDDQAEAVSTVVRQARDVDITSLATKADVKAEVAEVRAEIAASKAEILKWMFGQTLVILGAVAALLKLGAHP